MYAIRSYYGHVNVITDHLNSIIHDHDATFVSSALFTSKHEMFIILKFQFTSIEL